MVFSTIATSSYRWLSAFIALAGVLLLGQPSGQAAQTVVGVVHADTTIGIDANSDGDDNNNDGNGVIDELEDELLPLFAFGDIVFQNYSFGAVPAIMVRGGTEGSANSWSTKPLIRYQLSQAIDPNRLYFLELTTLLDGDFNSAYSVHAIDGANADIQFFDEATLTWNNSPLNARQRYSWSNAGPEVARFFESGPSGGGGVIRVPLLGSQIEAFSNGGNQYATFGIVDTESLDGYFASKEHTSGASRLLTFDAINTAGSGSLTTGSTYVGGAAPVAGNLYKIVNGHTVTASAAAFVGEGVIVENGTLNLAANNIDVKAIVVGAGGSITKSVAGDWGIGSTSATRNTPGLMLNGDLSLTPNAGADIKVNMPLRGAGTLTFNGSGAGSDLGLANPFAHLGDIVFAGTGSNLRIGGAGGFGGRVLMNSTGANVLEFIGDDSDDADDKAGTIVFNQPGTVLHSTPGTRLQGVANVELNAPVTFDLSQPAASGELERRFVIRRKLEGSGDILLKGPATAPVGPLVRGSLELGGVNIDALIDDPDSGVTPSSDSDYAGTITTQGYITIDMRLDATASKVVVGPNGVFQMGFQNRGDSDRIVDFGEVVVQGGGTLNVGYFSDHETIINEFDRANPQQSHEAGALGVRNHNGRSGNLTLEPGSMTVVQLNGTSLSQFDQIFVDGTATLGGTLRVLFDPNSVSPDNTMVANPNDPAPFPMDIFYQPQLGDTFDIIVAEGDFSSADFDESSAVDSIDLGIWQSSYGIDQEGDADGDGDTDGNDFLSWQRQVSQSGSSGKIEGQFSSLELIDPRNTLANAGLALQLNYIGDSKVQLTIVSAGSSTTVPEPGTFAMLAAILLFGACRRYK